MYTYVFNQQRNLFLSSAVTPNFFFFIFFFLRFEHILTRSSFFTGNKIFSCETFRTLSTNTFPASIYSRNNIHLHSFHREDRLFATFVFPLQTYLFFFFRNKSSYEFIISASFFFFSWSTLIFFILSPTGINFIGNNVILFSPESKCFLFYEPREEFIIFVSSRASVFSFCHSYFIVGCKIHLLYHSRHASIILLSHEVCLSISSSVYFYPGYHSLSFQPLQRQLL